MVQRKSRFWLEVLVLVVTTLGYTKPSTASSWSFEYDQGNPTANSEVREHGVSFTQLANRVHVYATFAKIPENPIPRGQQFITLGQIVNGGFKPAVRLGIHDGRRGGGDRSDACLSKRRKT